MATLSRLEGEKFMQRFFEATPDAHFKLIGTKSDLVPEASQVNRDVGIDLSSRLTTFIEDPGRWVTISDESALKKSFNEELFSYKL
ncbi:hypothetical protein JG687_00017569 [Phytophthora cactorum]|uniref:P-loop containing nucleoside triphosphate hydrolase n=1 Tax=Phytophthora cactorum TaxID=29920 RepID=A0A8T1TRR5_9STRA|nr:hypothetical protein GQ600_7578 [Phytophthora cactorum]KAG6944928.1 hypothetical protein JG687_00017569 [Phytophthora cactorum]